MHTTVHPQTCAHVWGFGVIVALWRPRKRCLDTEENVYIFFKAMIFKWAYLERVRHSMALDMRRKGKKRQECICVPGSCCQMYGHGLQVWVSGSQCKCWWGRYFISILQASVCLCTTVLGRVCVCVCVLNSTEQVVRYHPNTVAWQMAD